MIISKRTPVFRVPSVGISRALWKWLPALAILSTAALPALFPVGSVASAGGAAPQTAPANTPNSDPGYQQLRNITPGGKTIAVKDFVLKRDAGTFTF